MALPPMWTVYENPTDYPGKFVARLFHGETPTASIVIADDLETIRDMMQFEFGLVKLMRSPGDDPKIVEVWL
jgi:hypothetical protein